MTDVDLELLLLPVGARVRDAMACIDRAFTRLDRPTISAFIASANERSIRLARRLGMIEVGEPWPGVHQFQRRRQI